MKLPKLMLAGLLASALVTSVHADSGFSGTEVLITGSTAYRGNVEAAIKNILTAGYTYGYTGAATTTGTVINGSSVVIDSSGATQSIYYGTVTSTGQTVLIKTYWSGSVGGIYSVSQGTSVPSAYRTPFLQYSVVGGSLLTTGAANLTASTTTEIPDACLADCYQGSTSFTSPALTDTKVGVVPFYFVASNGSATAGASSTGITNITTQQAQNLFGNGAMDLSLFTGNASDVGTTVFAVGRDTDSGTRITALAETGIGALGNVVQWEQTINGSGVVAGTAANSLANGDNTAAAALTNSDSYFYAPAATLYDGLTTVASFGGYSSGGTLAKSMRAATNAGTGYSICYLGYNDTLTATSGSGVNTGPAVTLTYNGVANTTANIQNGSYTFWGYEHLMYLSSLSGVKLSTVTAVGNNIISTTAQILKSSMHVSRTSDGGGVGS